MSNNLSKKLSQITYLKSTGSGDFTTFLGNSKNVMLISDPEGQLSTGIINKIDNHIKRSPVIFLGDMGDYTTENVFDKDNLVFLKYIKEIIENPNCASVLGNRDLNKLNLWQLVQFDTSSKSANTTTNATANANPTANANANAKKQKNVLTNKWWTDGKTIKEIAEKLKKLCYTEDEKLKPIAQQPWLVKDLKSFAPYWNSVGTDKGGPTYPRWYGHRYGHTDTDIPPTLHNRYLSIFGADPKEGTMSAVNTNKGLLIEAGENVEDEELKAALVFTIYARMLDPELSSTDEFPYDGCLYRYLRNTPLVGFAEKKDKLYLFSHGGIHSNFSTSLYSDIEGKLPVINSFLGENQRGGNNAELNDIVALNKTIHFKIDEFYHAKLEDTQNEILRALIAMACPISKNPSIKDSGYRDTQSPIMPGVNTQFKLLYDDQGKLVDTVENENIYNIFGHAPFGFGYGFKIGKNGQKLVSCDFSSTVLKDFIKGDSPNIAEYNKNTLTLRFDAENCQFFTEGTVQVKIENEYNTVEKLQTEEELSIVDDNFFNKVLYIDGNLTNPKKITINYDASQPIKFDSNIPNAATEKVYLGYHGVGKINVDDMANNKGNNMYYIFGRTNGSFSKHLILINTKSSVVRNPVYETLATQDVLGNPTYDAATAATAATAARKRLYREFIGTHRKKNNGATDIWGKRVTYNPDKVVRLKAYNPSKPGTYPVQPASNNVYRLRGIMQGNYEYNEKGKLKNSRVKNTNTHTKKTGGSRKNKQRKTRKQRK